MIVVGHERARALLREHASGIPVLVSGPSGVGLSLVVREWVGGLVSRGEVHRVGVSSYPLEDASLSPMEAVRQIERDVLRRIPSPGRLQRVIVIDLDWLSASSDKAANALLLTLEEPPAGVQFVLTASRPPLATIESRCLAVRLKPLSFEECREVLDAAGADDPGMLARLSSGRPALGLVWARRLRLRPLATHWLRSISDGNPTILDSVFRAIREPQGEPLSPAETVEALLDLSALVERALTEVLHREPVLFSALEVSALVRKPVPRVRVALEALRSTARVEFRVRYAAHLLREADG